MQAHRTGPRALVAIVAALGLVVPAVPALANHGADPIRVGVRQFDGDVGRNQYDPSDRTVMSGTTVTFSFVDGFHNVVWSRQPAGSSLPNSPGAPGGDTVGSTFAVTPTVPGTYIYYCSIHTNAATANAATDFATGDTAAMYGRITVTADTTAPTWPAGATLTATPVSASQIDLSWPAASDDSGSAAYDVFLATSNSKPATPVVDDTAATSYSATGLTAGATYWFWVTPVDGAGNAGPDLTASATTSSVAASATAQTVLSFSVNPTLTIAVDNSALDFGTLNPALPSGIQTATVTIASNDTWSLSVKSIGRDGVDDTVGDDGVFTDDSLTKTIPVGRATWNSNPLTEAGDVVLTGQAAGTQSVPFDFQIALDPSDPVGTGYRTTVLYTATQP